jgi:outer membrane lipoprotein carrier protein
MQKLAQIRVFPHPSYSGGLRRLRRDRLSKYGRSHRSFATRRSGVRASCRPFDSPDTRLAGLAHGRPVDSRHESRKAGLNLSDGLNVQTNMSSFFLTLLVSLGLVAQSAPSSSPDDLAARVQQRYDTIKDFEADFVQTYEGGVLRTKTTERGTVAIKRPGRMRWVYSKPERKEFVSDGVRIYSYLPADKQVIVSPVPQGQSNTPALFLTGKGNLVRDFTVSPTQLAGAPAGLTMLKLVPKRSDPDVESLVLGVDPASLQIRHLVATDRQGGKSTFTFTNLKENRGLSDKIFEFRIPRGVDVITGGTLSK